MNKNRLWPIFLVVFLNMLGFGIIIPIIRDLTEILVINSNLNSNYFAIYSGILMASYSFFQFIFSPLLGRLSDIKGRKFVLIISLTGSIISYLMWAISNTYIFFLLSRVLAGITGASISVAQSYIADLTTDKDRAKHMGILGATFGLGFIVGPFLGGILSQIEIVNENNNMIKYNRYAAIGIASAATSLVNLVWIIIGLKESVYRKNTGAMGLKSITLFHKVQGISGIRNKNIARLILIYFFMQLGFNHIEAILAWDLKNRFGLDAKNTGYFFAFMGIILVIVQGGIYRVFIKTTKLIKISQIGMLVLIFGFTLMPISYPLEVASLSIAVLAFGMGISNPSIMTLASLKTNKEDQGLIMGIMQSFGSLSRIIAPIFSTFVYDVINHSFPYLISAILLIIGLILSKGIHDTK
jgi:MFS family permease